MRCLFYVCWLHCVCKPHIATHYQKKNKQFLSYTTSVTVNHHIYFVLPHLFGEYEENVTNLEFVFKKTKTAVWKKTGFFILLSASNDINHKSLIHKLKWFCAIDWIFTRFVTLRYHLFVTTFICRAVIKSRGPGVSPGYYECGPRLLLLENRRKIEPKEIPCCLIPRLLVVFTRQLEILVTTLICRPFDIN